MGRAQGLGTVGHAFSWSLGQLFPRPSLRNMLAWNGWSNPGWFSLSELYNSHSVTVHPTQKQGKTKRLLALLQHNLLAGRQNPILQAGTQQAPEPFQLTTVSWGSAQCQHNAWQGFIWDNRELVPTEIGPSSERRGPSCP